MEQNEPRESAADVFIRSKAQGNTAFKAGDYQGAVTAYMQGIAGFEKPILTGDFAATLWSNTSLAHAKAEQWGLSLRASECALLCDSCHRKATFRQATAYARLGHGRAACRAFKWGLSRIAQDEEETREVWEASLSEAEEVREREAERVAARMKSILDESTTTECLSDLVLRQIGFDLDAVASGFVEGYGRGLVAKRSLQAGDVLVTVPQENTLSLATLARPEVGMRMHSIQLDKQTRVSPQTELALLLMEQLHSMEDSPNSVYLASLPDHVASPLLFEPDAIDALHDGQLADEVAWRHRAPILADWSKLCSTAFWCDPGAWDPAIFHLDAFTRAVSLLSSRALPDRANQSVLIPGVDLLNTPSEAVAEDELRGAMVELGYPGPGMQFRVSLLGSVSPGDQIFLSYGRGKPNKSWMVHFGFVMPDNPAEQVEVDLYRDGSLSVYHEAIIRTLEASRSLTLRGEFRLEEVEEEVWVGIWVAGLSVEDARDAFERLEAEEEQGGEAEAASMRHLACREESLPSSYSLLAGALQAFLDSRRSSIEEDEAALEALAGLMESDSAARQYEHENMASALHYRLARKRIVARARSTLKYVA